MHQQLGGTGALLLKGVFLTTLMILLSESVAQAQTPDFAAALHDRGLPFAFGLAFRDPRVVDEARRFVAVRVDATRLEGAVETRLKRHGVLGLPAVVFLNSQGQTLSKPRVNEFLRSEELLKIMKQVQ